METADLLSLNELCDDYVQPSYNYFSVEQELIDTKRKLVLEEQNKVTDTKTSLIFYNSNLINLNSEEIEISGSGIFKIYLDAMPFIDVHRLAFHNEKSLLFEFWKQFKNIKVLNFNFDANYAGYTISNNPTSQSYFRHIKTVVESIVCSCKNFKINFVSTNYKHDMIYFDEFIKSTNYTEINIVNASYDMCIIKNHCQKNNIVFISNN